MGVTADLIPVDSDWVDVYRHANSVAIGISVGDAIVLQSFQSNSFIEIALQQTEPGADATNVTKLANDGSTYDISSGTLGVWARSTSSSRLSVQTAT